MKIAKGALLGIVFAPFLPWACSTTEPDDDRGVGGLFIDIPATGGRSGTGGTGGLGGAEGGLEICQLDGMESRAEEGKGTLFDDFEDGDANHQGNGTRGYWYAYGDGSLGANQSPTGDGVLPVSGGVDEDGFALRVQGSGFTLWGSGFGANFAYSPLGFECLFDGSLFSGFSFWARGSVEADGSTRPADLGVVKIGVVEKDIAPIDVGGSCDPALGDCWSSHRTRIELGDCWRRYTFRWEELAAENWGQSGGELDLDELYLLIFEVGKGQSYDIWLDRLEFFIGEAPESEELCDPAGMGGMGGVDGQGGHRG